jgi:hypothetical protein
VVSQVTTVVFPHLSDWPVTGGAEAVPQYSDTNSRSVRNESLFSGKDMIYIVHLPLAGRHSLSFAFLEHRLGLLFDILLCS